MQKLSRYRQSPLSRRSLLQVGAAGFLGLSLADQLRAEAERTTCDSRATSVIQIWLDGGPATIDMFDPKPDAPAEIRGDFKAVETAIPGVRFSDQMKLTAGILDRCAVIRSLHHNIPDHLPGGQYVLTGNKPTRNTEHPSLGSMVSHLLATKAGMPGYFSLGEAASTGAGFLGAQFDPFRIAPPALQQPVSLDGVVLPLELSENELVLRQQLRQRLSRTFLHEHADVDIVPMLSEFQQQAFDILSSNRIGQAFQIADEPQSIRDQYGDSDIGRSTLTARRLIESGARFVTVVMNGWDTHSNNFATLRQMLPSLDRALSGLVQDLDQRGMLQNTLVVCGGEFGRTPEINKAAGRDHWSRSIAYLLAGGGFARGAVYGATDDRGYDPIDRACTPDDLAATLLAQLGFKPQHKLISTSGRPIEMFKGGKVLDELLT